MKSGFVQLKASSFSLRAQRSLSYYQLGDYYFINYHKLL